MFWELQSNFKGHCTFPRRASICVRKRPGRRNNRGEVLKGVGLVDGAAKSWCGQNRAG